MLAATTHYNKQTLTDAYYRRRAATLRRHARCRWPYWRRRKLRAGADGRGALRPAGAVVERRHPVV